MRIRITLTALVVTIALTVAACAPSEDSKSEVSPGQTAFQTYCQTCHTLPKPSMKSDLEWPSLVKRYGARARLSDKKITLITDYLISAN